ncbi:MAG: hypothetical protein M3416_03925 [Acidobacteriota bacterium]|nr:hypothetical protein [Acidobacteriota bacterium]
MKRLVSGLCGVVLTLALSASAAGGAERVTQAGEVVVVLNEQFLNSLLEAVASQPEPPSFPLSKGGGGKCRSVVTLVREAEGRRTAVRFVEGRITAPVAFRGTYEAPLVGCLNFEGWADTAFDLSFDAAAQALKARINVRDVKLKNIPSAMSGGIKGLVQDAVDERVNPVEILRAEQLGARVPATRDNSLRLRAREVRHEVSGQELRLRIFYELVQAE